MTKVPRSHIFNCLLLTSLIVGLWTLGLVEWGGSATFIVDRTGERWDVSQAESMGFESEGFQYGIGKHAFTPLGDSHLQSPAESIPDGLRVIGVVDGNQAHAYSISRLRRHETANTTLNSKPVLVGY
jgi:hypothetical protein